MNELICECGGRLVNKLVSDETFLICEDCTRDWELNEAERFNQ